MGALFGLEILRSVNGFKDRFGIVLSLDLPLYVM